MSKDTQVTFRVPPSLAKRLDALAKFSKTEDSLERVSRSSITRKAVLKGLESLEKELGIPKDRH